MRALGHDAGSGEVRFDVEWRAPASVTLTAIGPIEPSEWTALARPASGFGPRTSVTAADDRWSLPTLTAGAWDFYWLRNASGDTWPFGREAVAAARNVTVSAGAHLELECAFREPRHVRVVLRNNDTVPAQLRPGAVWVDHVPCKRRPDGELEARLALDPSDEPRVELVTPFAGGRLVGRDVRMTAADELSVTIPDDGMRAVRIEPRFGGGIDVWTWWRPPILDMNPMSIPRRLQPFRIGECAFVSASEPDESVVACSATETPPAGAKPVFRGLFEVGPDAGDLTVELDGRWIDVIAGQPGMLTARASLVGDTVEAVVADIPSGSSRIWLPASVHELVFTAAGEQTVIDARTVGSVLSL